MSRSLPARRTDPRAAAAAFLSFVMPGLGQGYNGQWLLAKGDISAEEKDVLMELIRVRRKEDRYWGL